MESEMLKSAYNSGQITKEQLIAQRNSAESEMDKYGESFISSHGHLYQKIVCYQVQIH